MLGFEKLKSVLGGKKTEEEEVPNSPELETENNEELIKFDGDKFQYAIDFESIKNDIKQLITTYRKIALETEISDAVDEITNEAIVVESGEEIVSLNLENIEFSDKTKEKIKEEFEYVLGLLDFNYKAQPLFKQWYIDGRLHIQKKFNVEKPKEGIQAVEILSPLNLVEVQDKKTKERYYVYSASSVESTNDLFLYAPSDKQKLQIPKEQISTIYSGIIDPETKLNISYLHKCIKPLNQLRLLEDSAVIYRITRAPERRVFYIDTGKMVASKAQEYVKKMMNNFKTDVVYDNTTGKVTNKKNVMTMTEDFWLPTNSDGKGTKVETLPAGQNIDQIEDIELFKRKLIKSTKVPVSRFDSEQTGAGFVFGNSQEMSRDEVRFSKFINKLRSKISELLLDLLQTQLQLKNIISEEEWEKFCDSKISFDWNKDSYFSELKESEILKNRVDTIGLLDPYVGKYFTEEYVIREILKMNEEEIKKLEKYKAENPPADDAAGGW